MYNILKVWGQRKNGFLSYIHDIQLVVWQMSLVKVSYFFVKLYIEILKKSIC